MTREPDVVAAALSAALRREQDGAGAGEARAREAFRAARDADGGAVRRTRRRDDWRPAPVRERWHASLRTTALGVAAAVLLGGVAVAASGTLDPAPVAPPAPTPAPARETPGTTATPEPRDTGRGAPAVPTPVGDVGDRLRKDGADRPRGADKARGASEGRRPAKGDDRGRGAAQGKGLDRTLPEPPSETEFKAKGEHADASRAGSDGVSGPKTQRQNP